MLQSMEDASPVKWHLAHVTWFFETFILLPHADSYKVFNTEFGYLFNSYYQQIGQMHARPQRGLLSRPSAQEVLLYRDYVDQRMMVFLDQATEKQFSKIANLVAIGCAHEEQHQELIQTDILHSLSKNVILPAAYSVKGIKSDLKNDETDNSASDLSWIAFEGGLVETGASGDEFSFDNELPRHQYYLNPYELSSRPINNREYLEFMEDGGYHDAGPWLSDGWAMVREQGWQSPLYWRKADDGQYYQYTLFGEQPLDLDAPVRHVSYYEAAAYAAWSGVFLPSETEWEVAASQLPVEGQFLKNGTPALCRTQIQKKPSLQHMFGTVWEWTSSPYTAYPGYKPAAGAIGEYNGKFMSSQMVLRGGSCASPDGHLRASYRNFFPPDARWQFSGFRLAR